MAGPGGMLRDQPRLRRLLIAQLPSDFADWLDFVAITALLAYHWQVATPVYALLAVAMGLPYVVIGPLAGALADRLPLRAVMVAANLGKALVTASFALAPGWQALLALIFLRNAADAFFTPAKQAALQALTDEASRGPANALSHAINQGSKVISPALGGAALAIMAPANVFLLNALMSILAAGLLLRLGAVTRPAHEDTPSAGMAAALAEGWREVAAKPRLRAALALMAAGLFATFFYDTLIAPLSREIGLGESQLGYLLAAIGAGGVAGAFGTLRLRFGRPFRAIAAGAFLGATLVIAAGLTGVSGSAPGLVAVLPFAFGIGLASAFVTVPIRTLIQTETDPARMARVAALSEAANTAVMLVAPFAGAAIASVAGIGWAFVAGGALGLINAGAALWRDRREAGSRG